MADLNQIVEEVENKESLNRKRKDLEIAKQQHDVAREVIESLIRNAAPDKLKQLASVYGEQFRILSASERKCKEIGIQVDEMANCGQITRRDQMLFALYTSSLAGKENFEEAFRELEKNEAEASELAGQQ